MAKNIAKIINKDINIKKTPVISDDNTKSGVVIFLAISLKDTRGATVQKSNK